MKASDQPVNLHNVRIAAPCDKDWNLMQGDERVRFCNACSKNVYNISDMTTKEAEEFLRENGLSKCMRIFRRTDGTVVNDNCPVGLRKIRDGFRWAAACITWAISCCFAVTAAFAQSTQELLIKQLAGENCSDTTKKLDLPNKPQRPEVTGTVDLGGMFITGIEVEEVTKKATGKKTDKALRKKLLAAKFPTAFGQAINYHQLHDWDNAISSYRAALAEDPKFDSAYNNLALCLIERKADGDLDEATSLLSRSKKLSTEVQRNLFRLRDTHPFGGIVMEELPPQEIVKNGNTIFALARLSEERGDLDSAVKNYNSFLRQQPLNLIAIKQLSELYIHLEKPLLARAVISRALRLLNTSDDRYKILLDARTNLDRALGIDKLEESEKLYRQFLLQDLINSK